MLLVDSLATLDIIQNVATLWDHACMHSFHHETSHTCGFAPGQLRDIHRILNISCDKLRNGQFKAIRNAASNVANREIANAISRLCDTPILSRVAYYAEQYAEHGGSRRDVQYIQYTDSEAESLCGKGRAIRLHILDLLSDCTVFSIAQYETFGNFGKQFIS